MKRLFVLLTAVLVALVAFSFHQDTANAETGAGGFVCKGVSYYSANQYSEYINTSTFQGRVDYHTKGFRCLYKSGDVQSWRIKHSWYSIDPDYYNCAGGIGSHAGEVQNIKVDTTAFGNPVINTPPWTWDCGSALASGHWTENAAVLPSTGYTMNVQISLNNTGDLHYSWLKFPYQP